MSLSNKITESPDDLFYANNSISFLFFQSEEIFIKEFLINNENKKEILNELKQNGVTFPIVLRNDPKKKYEAFLNNFEIPFNDLMLKTTHYTLIKNVYDYLKQNFNYNVEEQKFDSNIINSIKGRYSNLHRQISFWNNIKTVKPYLKDILKILKINPNTIKTYEFSPFDDIEGKENFYHNGPENAIRLSYA